ncbi:D-alanyl-D-alanine carboxypeptidase family protein [Nioella aestuarii]|uniref:D-alanyl-D-alanine carboxypeptidase family protein n=1 Tax=Nioella aestuarii TaxID=1662864 RepID=UPI003D7F25A1
MIRRTLLSTLTGLLVLLGTILAVVSPAQAAPYAAMVIDARTGEVLHSRNADTRLHPASLTKMMTLYIAFEAIRLGEITLDTQVRISRNAAAEPPSRLGLQAGSTIRLRYLIRAAAIRSANDAATAIGEAISGSEAAFARRMNRTAEALGMTRTTFRNANGLTEEGHLSTARDMTTMGRRLFYDYPQYYNLFSRRTADAGIATVRNTNRRFLDAYRGADGIKTGYTRAAGYNLVASAERGNVRIIATVFGGRSSASRNERIMELLDMGFARAPANATVRRPDLPVYGQDDGRAGRTIRPNGLVTSSLRPLPRPLPAREPEEIPEASPDLIAAVEDAVEDALADPPEQELSEAIPEPEARPDESETEVLTIAEVVETVLEEAEDEVELASIAPVQRPEIVAYDSTEIELAVIDPDPEPPVQEIVTRASSTGSRLYGVSLGRYPSRFAAEQLLLRTALAELGTFDEALRNVVQRTGGFEAQFAGMGQEQAERACARLMSRNITCTTYGP